MTYVDTALLDVVERACHGFQALTGRTNVWLAAQLTNLSMAIYFAWMALYAASTDVWVRVLVTVFCGALVYVLLQTILRTPIEASEAAAYRRVAKGLRNPRRVRDAMLRVSFLTLTMVLCYPVVVIYTTLGSHIVLLAYSLAVLTTAVLYLLACDPLPPCPGKVSVWLREMGLVRATPAPAAGPVKPREAALPQELGLPS